MQLLDPSRQFGAAFLEFPDQRLAVAAVGFGAAGQGLPGLDGLVLGLFENRLEALEKDLRFGRLDQESVGAEVAGKPFVLGLCVSGGVDQERNAGQLSIGLPLPQQGVAVHRRHEQVADHDVGRLAASAVEGHCTVLGLGHFEAVGTKQRSQEVPVLLVVVDDQRMPHSVFPA